MGKDLYDNVPAAKALFEQANEILGFRITDIMFAGTDEEQTDPRHPTRRIPPLGHHGQGAGREARCRRRTLARRIFSPGGGRRSFVRRRSAARFQTCDGHAESLRSRTRYDGDSRSGRQGRGGDLRVDRRRGRGRQLQLPRPTGHLGQRRSGRCRLCQTQGRRAPNAHCVCPWAVHSTRR